MALMRQDASGMRMVRQGILDEVMGSSEYVQIESARAQVPERLGTLLPMNAGARDDDEELIRLENVTASYGDITVLTDVNWLMTARDHVVIEGPNGCGKSTLLSLIDGENHKGYGQQVFLFSRLKGSGETIWETKKHFGVVSNELHNKYSKGWRVLDVVVSGFFDSVGLYDETGAAQIEGARSWIEALGLQQLETHYYH